MCIQSVPTMDIGTESTDGQNWEAISCSALLWKLGLLNVTLSRCSHQRRVSQGAVSWSVRVWSSSVWRLIVLGVSISTSQASIVRAWNFHMSGLRHFRSLVFDEVAHQIACSIMGRLDYSNSLLLNCSNRNLDKLRSACRIIWPVSFATLVA